MSGRPDLVRHLPEVKPHEALLINKIQLHAKDLQLLITEVEKTPDLIVDGVVTEMKGGQDAKGDIRVQLDHANEQLMAHSKRHGLGLGAVAIHMLREKVHVAEVHRALNEFVASKPFGFRRVEVYAGDERRVFVLDGRGRFDLESRVLREKPAVAAGSREWVPDVLGQANAKHARLLKAAGAKATVAVFGSESVLPPGEARFELQDLMRRLGGAPLGLHERRRIFAARRAVEDSKYYEIARRFGQVAAEYGGDEIAVATAGGAGIAAAAN
ncbi:MAG: hypothetical protein HYZ74_05030, partial [Elusimicrobia bacterium]|nr:hypothetical protein [Elusimicrobiota bacterium]